MATADVKLPDGTKVKLTYLNQKPNFGPFMALQGLRSARMAPDSDAAKEYFSMAPIHAQRLAVKLDRKWDTVVGPPSSNLRAEPYRLAACDLVPVPDLRGRFSNPT